MWYVNKKEWFGVSETLNNRWNNNILYNLQSVARMLLFSWFFSTQGKRFKKITRILPFIYILSGIVYFSFYFSFLQISSYLLAMEAGFLLIYCLFYTYSFIKEDHLQFSVSHPSSWIVGGLTVYTSVSFFIFLFYNYLMKYYKVYAINVWDIHNFLFIILCTFISISFYHESNKS